MNRYNHIPFNQELEGIQSVINRMGASSIWSLSHIVVINQFQSVAVFEAWDSEAEEDIEFGRIPVTDGSLQNKNPSLK